MRPTKTPPPPSADRMDAHGRDPPVALGQAAWLLLPAFVFAVSDRLKIAVARDGLYCVAAGPHVEPHQGCPPLGRQQRFELLGIGVDEDEPEDVAGIGAGVEPDEKAA